MTIADRITTTRLFIAPIFFIIYFSPSFFSFETRYILPVLWLLFIVMELTDLFDGMAARQTNNTTDFGKLFDPFADVLARLTYFLCFAFSGLMPLWVLLLIIYREYGILFIRLLATKRGITMGARFAGKFKAVVYMIAGSVSMIILSLKTFNLLDGLIRYISIGSFIIYCLAGVLSIGSFIDYIFYYRSRSKNAVQ